MPAFFLGVFVEDVAHRIVSAVTVLPRIGSLRRDRTCALVQDGDAEAMLRCRSGEVCVPVKERREWVLPPAKLQLRGLGAVRGRSNSPERHAASMCPACASHRLER